MCRCMCFDSTLQRALYSPCTAAYQVQFRSSHCIPNIPANNRGPELLTRPAARERTKNMRFRLKEVGLLLVFRALSHSKSDSTVQPN